MCAIIFVRCLRQSNVMYVRSRTSTPYTAILVSHRRYGVNEWNAKNERANQMIACCYVVKWCMRTDTHTKQTYTTSNAIVTTSTVHFLVCHFVRNENLCLNHDLTYTLDCKYIPYRLYVRELFFVKDVIIFCVGNLSP